MNKFTSDKFNTLLLQNKSRALMYYFNTNKDVVLATMRSSITIKEFYDFYINETNSDITLRTFTDKYYKFKNDNKDYIVEMPKEKETGSKSSNEVSIKTNNNITPVVSHYENKAELVEPEPKQVVEETKPQEPVVNNPKSEDDRPVTEKSILKEHIDFYKLDEETRVDIKNKLKALRASVPDYKFNKYELNFIHEYKMFQNRGKVFDAQKDEKKFVWTAT